MTATIPQVHLDVLQRCLHQPVALLQDPSVTTIRMQLGHATINKLALTGRSKKTPTREAGSCDKKEKGLMGIQFQVPSGTP